MRWSRSGGDAAPARGHHLVGSKPSYSNVQVLTNARPPKQLIRTVGTPASYVPPQVLALNAIPAPVTPADLYIRSATTIPDRSSSSQSSTGAPVVSQTAPASTHQPWTPRRRRNGDRWTGSVTLHRVRSTTSLSADPRLLVTRCPGRIRTRDQRIRKPSHPTYFGPSRRSQPHLGGFLTSVASNRPLLVPRVFPCRPAELEPSSGSSWRVG
jgi:hypothetical protein